MLYKSRTADPERRATAFHEAGRAVAACRLGWPVDRVTLDPPLCVHRPDPGDVPGRLAVLFAGPVGEWVLARDVSPTTWWDVCRPMFPTQDLADAAALAAGREWLLRPAFDRAVALVARCPVGRETVEAVASELLSVGRVSGEDVAFTVRSLADY